MPLRSRKALIVVSVLLFAGAWADELPDSEVNPVSGAIESVESLTAGGVTNIRHSIDPGQGAPSVSILLSNQSAPDRSPRIAIRSDGVPGVVWWRDDTSGTVLLRTRADGTWDDPIEVSGSGDDARDPEIVAVGTSLWVAFEVDLPGGGTAVEVRRVQEDPNPIVMIRSPVEYAGDLDTLIHFALGELWVTWVESDDEVGWSVYDATSDTWSMPSYESYAADSVEDARDRIRAEVTGS